MSEAKTPRKRAQPVDRDQIFDPRDTPLHPRRREFLIGHAAAEARLKQAFAAGRMHHAWLISGPRGIGKATLAYRMARHMLRDDQLIAAGTHPDLLVIERPVNPDRKLASEQDGRMVYRLRAETTAEAARKAGEFFSLTAASGGWRVAIVDAADDLNEEAANALLKTLEEPPRNAVFFLISHAPGRLLPTIRSRCTRLTLSPLADADVAVTLGRLMGADGPGQDDLANAAALAQGSPGRALDILNSGGAALFSQFLGAVAGLPRLDRAQALELADQVQGRVDPDSFRLFCELMAAHVADRARDLALRGHPAAGSWAEAVAQIGHSLRVANALNLDRRQVILDALAAMEDAARA